MSGDSLQPSLLLRGQKQPLGTSIPNPKGSYLQVQAHPHGTAWSCPRMWLLSVSPPPAAGCENPASNMVTLQGCSRGWRTTGCSTGDKERLVGAGGGTHCWGQGCNRGPQPAGSGGCGCWDGASGALCLEGRAAPAAARTPGSGAPSIPSTLQGSWKEPDNELDKGEGLAAGLRPAARLLVRR